MTVAARSWNRARRDGQTGLANCPPDTLILSPLPTRTRHRDTTHGFLQEIPFGPGLRIAAYSTVSGNLSTVTDNASRTLSFTWTGSHITSVTDSNVSGNTRTLSYSYDGNGNLQEVTDLNGGETEFVSDSSHRIVLMRMPNYHSDGSLPSSGPSTCTSTPTSHSVNNHYDSSGRVDCQWDPNGKKTTFAYTCDPTTATGGTTTTTDPADNATFDQYQFGLRTLETQGYGSVRRGHGVLRLRSDDARAPRHG